MAPRGTAPAKPARDLSAEVAFLTKARNVVLLGPPEAG